VPAQRIRVPEIVGACLKQAATCLQNGDPAQGIDWLAAAAVADIQQHQLAFLSSAAAIEYFADQYTRCLESITLAPPFTAPENDPSVREHRRPIRVLYIAPSITQGQAASNRLARLVEAHHPSEFAVSIIVTEEFTARTPPLQIVKWPDAPSARFGEEPLARIRAAGVPLHFLSTRGSHLEAAQAGIALARSLNPDVAVFIASPACPIQAAMAHHRVAPVQINQNIGAPLLVRGMDAAIYHNATTAAADEPLLTRRGVRLHVMPSVGTDIARSRAAIAMDRAELGIHATTETDTILLVSASNKLPERMLAGSFAADLAAFLRTHRNAIWIGVGRGDFSAVQTLMESYGVLPQIRFTGALSDIRPAVKACGIYLNEYPEGGCNTVLEAMACGLPVAALHAGPAHTEHIGADLVGEPYACKTTQQYWNQVHEWCTTPESRALAAETLLHRVAETFDSLALIRAYESVFRAECSRTATRPPPLTANSGLIQESPAVRRA